MKKRLLLSCFLLSLFLFSQCGGDEAKPAAPKKLYAVGQVTNAGKDQATLWVDGKATPLFEGKFSRASDVAVLGNDVYVSGYYVNANNFEVACYWKNGTKMDLGKADEFTAANSIALAANGDVYVAGYSGKNEACYWKNGIITILPEVQSTASNIFVVNSDVYVVGHYFNNTRNNRVACYWKNNVKTDLTDSKQDAFTNSVFINGSDIYVSGTEGGSCKIWKNAEAATNLGGNFAKEVRIINSNVYAVGQKTSTATLWKDGVASNVSSSTASSQGRDFAIDNEVVYVGGNETVNSIVIARLWKNGQPMDIALPANGTSNINSVVFQ